MSSAHENRVHLCRLSPRRAALDVYFADDDIASEAEPLWELPPDYDTGDTLVIVVPAREPAILNIETLTSSSADGGCDTEDSAGAEIDGVSVPGIERRMGEPMPAAPATLDPDYAARWMAAFDAERADPTPWYLRDTTGCAESAVARGFDEQAAPVSVTDTSTSSAPVGRSACAAARISSTRPCEVRRSLRCSSICATPRTPQAWDIRRIPAWRC